jgi:transposase
MKSRRNYDEEFKKQAVRLSHESGKSISQVAQELGVAKSALYEWRAQTQTGKNTPPPVGKNAKGSSGREEEVTKLREQLRIMTMERDILKKAIQVLGR